jgi:hypothetical protein
VADPQLVIVAKLTCSDDLKMHVGLAQLLTLPNLRFALVLSFPNTSIANIARAQARREQWHGVVRIMDVVQCQQMLAAQAADTPLVVFSGPAILNPRCLDEMTLVRHPWLLLPERNKDGSPFQTFHYGTGFIGRAGDYAAWEAEPEIVTDAVALGQAIDREPADLGFSGRKNDLPAKGRWPKTIFPIEMEHSGERSIDLADVGSGDELVLRTIRDPLPTVVIERQSARLNLSDETLAIRLPGHLLTTAPKIARLELYKANGRVQATNLLLRTRPQQLRPWMLSAFLNRGGGGNPVIRAFAEGVGCRLSYAEDEPERLSDIPVVWGVLRDSARILSQAQKQSIYFFYIDHAYFDRGHGKSYRISRNRYEAGPVRKSTGQRLKHLDIHLEPWRKSGHEILVCPPTDYFVEAHDCSDWLETTLQALRGLTERPIVIREKPQPGTDALPLRDALQSAHALVTHSSNVAIEAACLGTPVFVNPASAAAPVGQTDLALIETPVYPDREPWLAHLADNQFSIDEIRAGEAWRMLLELEETDFV